MNSVAVLGLGYVGLPLTLAISSKYQVVGYDNNIEYLRDINKSIPLIESNFKDFSVPGDLTFTSDLNLLIYCNIYIISLPILFNQFSIVDSSYILATSTTIGSLLKSDDIIIFEATVYNGCTEQECLSIIELNSGLKKNNDFKFATLRKDLILEFLSVHKFI